MFLTISTFFMFNFLGTNEKVLIQKWLLESKAEILDKQELTSILFIPRMIRLLVVVLLLF